MKEREKSALLIDVALETTRVGVRRSSNKLGQTCLVLGLRLFFYLPSVRPKSDSRYVSTTIVKQDQSRQPSDHNRLDIHIPVYLATHPLLLICHQAGTSPHLIATLLATGTTSYP